jgi:hypothetical protein
VGSYVTIELLGRNRSSSLSTNKWQSTKTLHHQRTNINYNDRTNENNNQPMLSGGVNTPVGSSTHVETAWAGTTDSGTT